MANNYQVKDGNGNLVTFVSTDTGGAVQAVNHVGCGVYTVWGSLPAAATGTVVQLQADPAGTAKVGVAPLGTPVYGSSNGPAQANNVTLTIPATRMGFLDGIDIDGLGANVGAAILVTITGLLGGTLTFAVPVILGVTSPNPSFSKRFNPPLQASATGVNVVVNCPSFGTGNSAASVNAYGHYV